MDVYFVIVGFLIKFLISFKTNFRTRRQGAIRVREGGPLCGGDALHEGPYRGGHWVPPRPALGPLPQIVDQAPAMAK